MTGIEQMVVWLSGLFLTAVTVSAVAKARAEARIQVARAQLEASQALLQAQSEALHVPPEWTKGGGS